MPSRVHLAVILDALKLAIVVSLATHGCATNPTTAIRDANQGADANERKCRDMMAALVSDSPEAAEKDFGDRMREALPPLLLRASWRGLVVKNGPLSSWRIAKRDHEFGKDRFTLELQFVARVAYALVVFEPPTGQVIGLFFPPAPRGDQRVAYAPDPRVREVDALVGAIGLPGKLTLPREAGTTRLPGVVLIAGSGPADRDETVGNWKPFRDLAFALAARGIVTLRYDKRTFAQPDRFDPKTGTVEEEVIADAIDAVEKLRATSEVDPTRLFVVGHSLGALLAPEIAARAGGVAGLVLLAAPGRPLPEILLEQLRTPDTKPSDLAALEARVRALPKLAGNELVLGLPASYWQDLSKRDEMATAQKLGRPVLLLRGAMDRNVSAVDQERWNQALSGRVPLQNFTLPGLNHLLVPSDAHSAGNEHVPDDVSARIAAFVEGTPKTR